MESFEIKSGDRIVFFGDSITEQQLYTVYVEAFIRTRFPELDVRFFNRGWGGDVCTGYVDLGGLNDVRSARDIAPLKPNVVTVLMGMNDGGYTPYQAEREDSFRKNYALMLDNLQSAAPRARFTLIRTSPWDQYTCKPSGPYPGAPYPPDAYNDALLKYGKAIESYAKERGMKYVDFNLPMVEVMVHGKVKDVSLANQIVPDWIHPGPPGHLIMAGELLKAWHAPSAVSEVRLDASSKTVSDAKGAEVRGFDGTSWKQGDSVLPFCVSTSDPGIRFVLDIYDFQEKLNRQALSVVGLEPGDYEIHIDGELVGEFASADLERGVNLSDYETPMTKQAVEVLALLAKRSALQMTRWRQIDVCYELTGAAAEASEGLERMEEEVLQRAIERAKPVEHTFQVVRR